MMSPSGSGRHAAPEGQGHRAQEDAGGPEGEGAGEEDAG